MKSYHLICLPIVTNENHFIDGDLYYQFTIEKVLAMKLAAFLCPQELTQPTLGGSPLAQRRNPMMKNQLPPLKTGRSSPVPFRKQRTIEDAVNGTRKMLDQSLFLGRCPLTPPSKLTLSKPKPNPKPIAQGRVVMSRNVMFLRMVSKYAVSVCLRIPVSSLS